MFVALFLLLFQASLEYTLLEVEDARAEDATALVEALGHSDANIQRIAVRGVGRLERPELADKVRPLLGSPDAGVRMEAVNAIGRMGGAGIDLESLLQGEKNGGVRGVIYQTLGRLPGQDEALLVEGLLDQDPKARTGAAKGLESFFRLTESKPRPATLTALRKAVREDNPSDPNEACASCSQSSGGFGSRDAVPSAETFRPSGSTAGRDGTQSRQDE